MVVGTVKNRNVPQVKAFILQIRKLLGHEPGLLIGIPRRYRFRQDRRLPDRLERLFKLALVIPDAGVGKIQDLGRGTIINLELENLRSRMAGREIDDVGEVRTAK